MLDDIYMVREGSELVRMSCEPYEDEPELQRLLADFPRLLADPGGSDTPWLLVRREPGIPSEEGGSDRWALDHLFLDEEGMPTLVEVKRSSDTRLRRRVVGQMLDYAANAVMYWPIQTLIDAFEETCEARGRDPDEEILALDSFDSVPEFWDRVETNLRAGKIRLIFVADQIPRELQRIVEFLNGQMSQAQVLAIEVRKFLGADGEQALVPRMIGQTAQAEMQKTRSRSERFASEFRAIFERFHEVYDGEWEASNEGRLIYAWPDHRRVHYEFRREGDSHIGVELHIEADEHLSDLRPVLESFDGARVLEREVRWDPSWYSERGRLQVLFQMSDGPDEIAKGMRKLIEMTRPAVDDVVGVP